MATNSLPGQKLEILVMYKECLHNHAAKAAAYALDGCGQFVAKGPDGNPEAMVCAACDCHRNFHRRVEVELSASYINPENNALSRQNEAVIPSASLSHPQPPQRPIYQHARTSEPTTIIGRHQTNQPAGLQLGASLATNSERPPVTRSEDVYQPRLSTLRLSRVPQLPTYQSPAWQMTEPGLRMRRKRLTEEQVEALRTVSERNNWKMFREYAKEEVNRICSSIGVTRGVMKRWISRQRRKRAAAAAATAAAAAEGAEPATVAGEAERTAGGSRGGSRNNESRDSSTSTSSSTSRTQ